MSPLELVDLVKATALAALLVILVSFAVASVFLAAAFVRDFFRGRI